MARGPDPSPLAHSASQPFTVRHAHSAGASARRLRARDLDGRVYGVRAAAGSADDLWIRCRMFAARLPPTAFVSHSTAALLYGVPLPWRLETLTRIHSSVPSPDRAPHASGLIGHSRVVLPGDVVDFNGIPVSSPSRMLCEMAGAVALPDLVAVVDHLIRRRAPLCNLVDLARRLEGGDRITRHRHLRVAIELADARAESRPETHLRLLLRELGLPSPRINHELVDTETGGQMRTDFAYPDLKFAIEYQGDYHRTRDQWRRDMTRRSRLEALGWYVLELNADDLRNPNELAARIRATLARRAR